LFLILESKRRHLLLAVIDSLLKLVDVITHLLDFETGLLKLGLNLAFYGFLGSNSFPLSKVGSLELLNGFLACCQLLST
jgi:hypothetical protein